MLAARPPCDVECKQLRRGRIEPSEEGQKRKLPTSWSTCLGDEAASRKCHQQDRYFRSKARFILLHRDEGVDIFMNTRSRLIVYGLIGRKPRNQGAKTQP